MWISCFLKEFLTVALSHRAVTVMLDFFHKSPEKILRVALWLQITDSLTYLIIIGSEADPRRAKRLIKPLDNPPLGVFPSKLLVNNLSKFFNTTKSIVVYQDIVDLLAEKARDRGCNQMIFGTSIDFSVHFFFYLPDPLTANSKNISSLP